MAQYTKQVWIGGVPIGGGAPISVQSMTNCKTLDVAATVSQIQQLEKAGCQIVRVAIPNTDAVTSFAQIKKQVQVPLVADIHFDYRLALAAIDCGADKIRINPGNIGGKDCLKSVVQLAARNRIPIRVGVNSGSIEKDILREEGGPTVRALVRSAMRNLALCKDFGAEALVLSLKSSDVIETIEAYRQVSQLTDVPLHIGVTEAGTLKSGTIRSAVALGILLHQGIGDTLRVSLTSDPVDEVKVGYQILKSLRLAPPGVTIISCPTCGRTEVDLIAIVNQVENELANMDKNIVVAIMGCEVNGPGEAKEADIGIACGKKSAVLFKNGKIVRKVKEEHIVAELIKEVEEWSPPAV